MKLTIKNKAKLDAWLREKLEGGSSLVAIKGPPPKGATYSDGSLIVNQVNIGWKELGTGEVFHFEYEQEKEPS